MLLPPLTLLLVLSTAPTLPRDEPVLDPVAARLTAAHEAYFRRDLGLAHELLQKALEEAPGEPAVRLWLARVQNDLGHGEEAARTLGPALEGNDGSGWLWTELGRARRLVGDAPAAERALRAAIDRGPRLGPPRLLLVELLVEGGRAPEAEPILAPLLEEAADVPQVVLAHAALLDALGRGEEAEARLRAAVDHPAARLALARRLLAAERHEEAWTVAEPLLDGARERAQLMLLASVAQATGREVEALAILGALLLDDPTDPVALAGLNELIEHRGVELRRGLTERWVGARPDDADAWRELLETDLDSGCFGAFFERLETVPAAARLALPVRLLEGEALRRAGRSEEARAVLEELCADSAEPRAYYELGLLEYAAGHTEAAVAAFERGAASRWAADAHFNRGVCLDRLQRYAEAAQAYRAATEARPEFAEAWYQLAVDQRYRLGQPQRARASYRRYLDLGGDDPEVRRYVEDGR